MRKALIVGVITALFCGMSIAGENKADLAENGRYSWLERDGDLLRLDRKNGTVSTCARTGTHWTCRSVADDRAALEAEIDRLTARIKRLEKRLAATRKTPREAPILDLPSRKEVDEMMGFMEDFMTRFKGMVDRLDKQAPKMNKPSEDIPEPDRT